jgi:hypothetical protein
MQMKQSQEYTDTVKSIKDGLEEMQKELARTSVPFWSMRYLGHMNWDTTLPGTAAYLATSLYNPNNVAYEASPYTSGLEAQASPLHCTKFAPAALHLQAMLEAPCSKY